MASDIDTIRDMSGEAPPDMYIFEYRALRSGARYTCKFPFNIADRDPMPPHVQRHVITAAQYALPFPELEQLFPFGVSHT